jgi:hypothetical protein
VPKEPLNQLGSCRSKAEHGALVHEMLESDIAEDAIRSLIPENTTNDHYTVRMLTPLLTPLRAQHVETMGNLQQRSQLR